MSYVSLEASVTRNRDEKNGLISRVVSYIRVGILVISYNYVLIIRDSEFYSGPRLGAWLLFIYLYQQKQSLDGYATKIGQ